MSRSPVVVSVVRPDTRAEFERLWLLAQVESGASGGAAARYAADGRLTSALLRPEVHVLVARRDRKAVGYAILTDQSLGLVQSPDLAIDQIFVAREERRRGIARHLLAAAVVLAERSGIERVVSNVPAANREANRFYARLGFAPATTRRVTSTSSLRRRALGGADVSPFESVLRRRRVIRTVRPTRSA